MKSTAHKQNPTKIFWRPKLKEKYLGDQNHTKPNVLDHVRNKPFVFKFYWVI